MANETGKTEPASRRLAAQLRAAIESGELAPGDKLPSERKLVETHDVARNTAREAVRLLADEGLVTVEHGRLTTIDEEEIAFQANRKCDAYLAM